MVARVVVAAVAAAMLLWLGLLLRGEYLAQPELLVTSPSEVSRSEFDDAQRRLRDAERLNPDPYFDLSRAWLFFLHGRSREAAREAEAVVRDEPDNYEAWVLLFRATSAFDRRRAARAAAEIRRVNPLAGAGAGAVPPPP